MRSADRRDATELFIVRLDSEPLGESGSGQRHGKAEIGIDLGELIDDHCPPVATWEEWQREQRSMGAQDDLPLELRRLEMLDQRPADMSCVGVGIDDAIAGKLELIEDAGNLIEQTHRRRGIDEVGRKSLIRVQNA